MHLGHRRREAVALDRLAIQAYALVISMQVGADIETGAHAGRVENALGDRAGAALPLRAGYVDRRAPEMRIAELIKERTHGREVRSIAEIAGTLEVGQRSEPSDGVVVVHGSLRLCGQVRVGKVMPTDGSRALPHKPAIV